MSKISVAFGITEDWLEYCSVVMSSILSNTQNDLKFYILSDISEDVFFEKFNNIKTKLSKIRPFNIEYLKMNNADFDGVVHDKRVGISAYYRLKLPSILKEDRVIYLDSDIVVTDNISKLWNYDIEDYLIGGVEDKYSSLMSWHADLEDGDIYINSGVLLMNLKKFRSENIEEKIFEKLREKDNLYSDQDVLNNICRNRILYLPLKYNLMLTADDENSFPDKKDEYNEALASPFILHYSIKPWALPVEYSEYWRKYRDILL